MKFQVTALATIAVFAIFTISVQARICCEDDPHNFMIAGENCVDLLAGQHTLVGSVCVSIVNGDLHVAIVSTDVTMMETHLWFGLDPNGYPQNKKGNPKIGHFPYSIKQPDNEMFYVVELPYLEICDCTEIPFYIMAHAAMANDETAWADGDRVTSRGSWATRATFYITDAACASISH